MVGLRIDALLFGRLFGLLTFGLLCLSVSFLLARHLLQSEELLSVQLVQLRVDVFDRVFCSGNDNVLAEDKVS